MRIDEGLDTGPVYLCESTPISPDETVQELSERLAKIGAPLTAKTISGIRDGSVRSVPQDDSRASLAPLLRKTDGIVDWAAAAKTIHDRVRAFNPWPGTVAAFRGAIYKIRKSKVGSSSPPGSRPGEIVECKKTLSVACGDGQMLEILSVQAENRGATSGVEFANGRRVECGERFERV
jgi:methionyl-tRNA formyltransferase